MKVTDVPTVVVLGAGAKVVVFLRQPDAALVYRRDFSRGVFQIHRPTCQSGRGPGAIPLLAIGRRKERKYTDLAGRCVVVNAIALIERIERRDPSEIARRQWEKQRKAFEKNDRDRDASREAPSRVRRDAECKVDALSAAEGMALSSRQATGSWRRVMPSELCNARTSR